MALATILKKGWNELTDRDKLEFDTENLRTQARAINNIVQDLTKAQRTLSNNLAQLRQDWQTEAGDEFFKKYDEKWAKLLNNHVELLNQLVSALLDCANSYDPLSSEYDKISLQ